MDLVIFFHRAILTNIGRILGHYLKGIVVRPINHTINLILFIWLGLLPLYTMAADLELEGPLTQGALVMGKTQPGSRVLHDGKPVRLSERGEFLIGFERDAPVLSKLRITLPDGTKIRRELKIAQREYDIQRIDGLPPRKVTPDPADLARIRADSAAAKKARSLNDERTDFLSGFEWPAIGRISGVYGSQRILNGEPRRPHYGVDIARPAGTPVKAPADAIVTLAHPDMFYSGATLIMDHGHGLSSTFLHLQEILVKEGQRVKRGEVVARLGASGRATGPHLDYRVRRNGRFVNPRKLKLPAAAPVPDDDRGAFGQVTDLLGNSLAELPGATADGPVPVDGISLDSPPRWDPAAFVTMVPEMLRPR